MWEGDDDVITSVFRLKITKNENGYAIENWLFILEFYLCFVRIIVFFWWNQREDKGELHLRKGKGQEVYFTDMEVTDEIREMDGKIIKCLYLDGRWVFKKLKNDRKHPNGFKTVQGRLIYH